MGAMAQSFQGLGTPGPAAQKIGQLGSIGQQLGAGGGAGGGALGAAGRGNPSGAQGFKRTRPGLGQLAGQVAQRAGQQAAQLQAPHQPGAPKGAPVAPTAGGAAGANPSQPGPVLQPQVMPGQGANPPAFLPQGGLSPANLQPLPGAQGPLTPGVAIGGAGGIGMGRRFPQQLLGNGGWGSQGDASGLPPGTVF